MSGALQQNSMLVMHITFVHNTITVHYVRLMYTRCYRMSTQHFKTVSKFYQLYSIV